MDPRTAIAAMILQGLAAKDSYAVFLAGPKDAVELADALIKELQKDV